MRFLFAVLLLGIAALSGCRNRARSELYLDNLAAENRNLEDQLYEYDHEYRLLEQELQSLRLENARLQDGVSAEGQGSGAGFWKADRANNSSGDSLPTPSVGGGSSILDGIDKTSNSSGGDRTAPSAGNLPAFPGSDSQREPIDLNDSFDPDDLSIPSIEPGEPMPPPQPNGLLQTSSGLPSSEGYSLEMNLSQVEVPAQLASNSSLKLVGNAASDGMIDVGANPEKITDKRIVEIAFHPSLSRAANFDESPEDDGVYLVLQPMNEQGQMVPTAASLSVVVLDPAREGNAARIARWDYSDNDVEAKMQPIGSKQGIHLTLPWQGAKPSADRVIVFARYTFPNGRQVIGQKEIFVSGGDGFPTVWTSRSASSVQTASASETSSLETSARPNNVVRPANATTASQPAPAPR